IPKEFDCKVCGNSMKRLLSAPNTTNRVVIDNGLMAKAIEYNPNTEAMMDEKADKDFTKKE
ncbi:MAG: hypothetical protein ABI792_02550, partial [bacterium]